MGRGAGPRQLGNLKRVGQVTQRGSSFRCVVNKQAQGGKGKGIDKGKGKGKGAQSPVVGDSGGGGGVATSNQFSALVAGAAVVAPGTPPVEEAAAPRAHSGGEPKSPYAPSAPVDSHLRRPRDDRVGRYHPATSASVHCSQFASLCEPRSTHLWCTRPGAPPPDMV